MPLSFVCPSCKTAYRLPEHLAGQRPLRARCARCKEVFDVPRPPSLGPAEPGVAPGGRASPARAPAPEAGQPGEYDLGPLPGGEDDDLGPTLGDQGPAAGERERTVRLGGGDLGAAAWSREPSLGPGAGAGRTRPGADGLGPAGRGTDALPGAERPFRRTPPPAASGRRAFLAGLLGVVAIGAAGVLAVRAWRGRDWLAFLTGEPFEVTIRRRRALTGRAGALYVVDGTIRNLSGTPKGFFEVRGRLLDEAGKTIAERVVYAGQVLDDPELKGLSRAELERRFSETVFGEGMANARVEPRRSVPFQIVFLPAPASSRIADVAVDVAGAKDVP